MTSNTLARGVRQHTTHFACPERMAEYGGGTVGCCCTGHVCKIKVLFLDVDGVLNCKSTTDRWPKGSRMLGVDPTKVDMVTDIINITGCKVVLSSTWRLSSDSRKYIESLLPIMDVTPSLQGLRGAEVKAWLDEHPEVERYAILDDDSDFLEGQPLFLTKFMGDGLTREITHQVIEYLKAAQ